MYYSSDLFSFTAGADVLITNTYQASIGGFVTHLGLNEEESYELVKTAVHLAKKAHSIYMAEEDSDGDILLSVFTVFELFKAGAEDDILAVV
jgi:S-methylmethionine-dependent homocysteine/selenocysteine methylase